VDDTVLPAEFSLPSCVLRRHAERSEAFLFAFAVAGEFGFVVFFCFTVSSRASEVAPGEGARMLSFATRDLLSPLIFVVMLSAAKHPSSLLPLLVNSVLSFSFVFYGVIPSERSAFLRDEGPAFAVDLCRHAERSEASLFVCQLHLLARFYFHAVIPSERRRRPKVVGQRRGISLRSSGSHSFTLSSRAFPTNAARYLPV